jgi:hypothetical protein
LSDFKQTLEVLPNGHLQYLDDSATLVDSGYNQKGLLSHSNGLLHKVIDPKGKIAAQISFGKGGKATAVSVRSAQHRLSQR